MIDFEHIIGRVRPGVVGFIGGTIAVTVGSALLELGVSDIHSVWLVLSGAAAPVVGWAWHTRRRETVRPVTSAPATLLADAEEVAPIGWWSLELNTGAVTWSPAMRRLLALGPAGPGPSLRSVLRCVTPADRAVLFGLVREVVEAPPEQDGPSELCIRVLLPHAEARVLRLRLRLERDQQNRPKHLVGVCMDLTAPLNDIASLSMATEEAMAIRRIKQVLLDNISHEIRTPLTSIIGFAEILHEELDEQHRAFLQPIRQNGERLLTTMTALLNLAYLEGHSAPVIEGQADVTMLVLERSEAYREQARRKGRTLQVALPRRRLYVPLTPNHFNQLLDHLLSNALKFTAEGSVEVGLTAEDGGIRMRVTDTGIGISDGFRSRLFEPFHQESGGRTRAFEGMGLGLAVVKHIVEAAGGHVAVHSQKGQGTTFTISLPRCEGPASGESLASHPTASSSHHYPPTDWSMEVYPN